MILLGWWGQYESLGVEGTSNAAAADVGLES